MQPLGESKRANSGPMSAEVVSGQIITKEHSGRGVSPAGLPSLFPEWCLHRLLGLSRGYTWKKDRTTLQRLMCTDTKGGNRTLRLTRLHWTHITDLSEERLKKEKEKIMGGK